jgi:hypothetical protein
VSPNAIADALGAQQKPRESDYSIVTDERFRMAHAFFGRSREGNAALLIPLARAPASVTRLTSGLALRAFQQLGFVEQDCARSSWSGPVAVLECLDPRLTTTFAAVSLGIHEELTGKPTWQSVVDLFGRWEELLGRRRVLSDEAELGLWGELWLLTHTAHPDVLLSAWRAPDGTAFDFLLEGISIEVKTSRRSGSHVVSQSQLEQPAGNARHVLLSLFAQSDPTKGLSLPQLIARVTARLADSVALERGLLAAGYSHVDAEAYSRRYAVMSVPQVYDASDVPRVRVADPGVSQLRFRVEMPPDKALAAADLSSVWAALGSSFSDLEYPCV